MRHVFAVGSAMTFKFEMPKWLPTYIRMQQVIAALVYIPAVFIRQGEVLPSCYVYVLRRSCGLYRLPFGTIETGKL